VDESGKSQSTSATIGANIKASAEAGFLGCSVKVEAELSTSFTSTNVATYSKKLSKGKSVEMNFSGEGIYW